MLLAGVMAAAGGANDLTVKTVYHGHHHKEDAASGDKALDLAASNDLNVWTLHIFGT